MENEIEALKGRLTFLETRLASLDERLARPVRIVLDGPGEPLEVFAVDKNLKKLRRAVRSDLTK